MYDDTDRAEILARLEQARDALADAERRNAAATLARREPPHSADDIRQLEYAVADIAEEAYGGDTMGLGPQARRLTFPAAG